MIILQFQKAVTAQLRYYSLLILKEIQPIQA